MEQLGRSTVFEQALARVGGDQADLAAALGVSPSTVSRWVNNPDKIVVEVGNLLRIATITGMRAADVLRAFGYDPARFGVPDREPSGPIIEMHDLALEDQSFLRVLVERLRGAAGFAATPSAGVEGSPSNLYQPVAA